MQKLVECHCDVKCSKSWKTSKNILIKTHSCRYTASLNVSSFTYKTNNVNKCDIKLNYDMY